MMSDPTQSPFINSMVGPLVNFTELDMGYQKLKGNASVYEFLDTILLRYTHHLKNEPNNYCTYIFVFRCSDFLIYCFLGDGIIGGAECCDEVMSTRVKLTPYGACLSTKWNFPIDITKGTFTRFDFIVNMNESLYGGMYSKYSKDSKTKRVIKS